MAGLRGERDALKNSRSLEDERTRLKEDIEKLRIEKARSEEDSARRVREVEHDTGLLRKQVEWERTKAVEEAKLAAREENLTAEQTRFTEQMSFHKDQIANEVDRLDGLLKALLERLPTVSVEKTIELDGKA